MYQSGGGQAQSVDGGLPSKTPVSLLQELCMRRGISPKYDLLQIEGPVHEPTFVYRVTVGEYAANGSGQTKKKAKHAAAKAVLDIIIQGGGSNSGSTPELSSQIVSPYDDGIPGNPVGALQELCMSRRWPPPTYELTSEEGFPHERTFSICCTIGSHKEIGAGKSKKLSKRQAANKMIQKLKDQPVDHPPMNVLADDDDEVNTRSSASPLVAPPNSCSSLSKACRKASYSILQQQRVCPHIADVFNSGSYQVCGNCFEVLRGFQTRDNKSSLRASVSKISLNESLISPQRNLEAAPQPHVCDLNNNIKPSSKIENGINCHYTSTDMTKLEEMFDKLIDKHAEEMAKAEHRVKGTLNGHIGDDDHDEVCDGSLTNGKHFTGPSNDEHVYSNGVVETDQNFDMKRTLNTEQRERERHEVSELETRGRDSTPPRLLKGILTNFHFDAA